MDPATPTLSYTIPSSKLDGFLTFNSMVLLLSTARRFSKYGLPFKPPSVLYPKHGRFNSKMSFNPFVKVINLRLITVKSFKNLFDKLASMGCSIDVTGKLHWFLRGLGDSFTQFAFNNLFLILLPIFKEIVSTAISFELFHSLIAHRSSPKVEFNSNNCTASNQFGRPNQHTHYPNSTVNHGNSLQSGHGGN